MKDKARLLIDEAIELYYEVTKREREPKNIPYAGRVYDDAELKIATHAVLDFMLTGGDYTHNFEEAFAEKFEGGNSLLVNSGSSANLLAISALTSPLLGGKRLRPGDEVITVAAGFPTTLNPILQNGLIPVFVDITLDSLNIDVSLIEDVISDKTKAIFIAHTLGIPASMDALTKIAKKHNLYLIEDCCDALGSLYDGKYVGTFGNIATFSFYPAHHITMGEGGAVCTKDPLLYKILKSLRDWGRDCVCPPGVYNRCGNEFAGDYGTLPHGYDHRYVYSHIGYNFKATEIQAAIGIAQLGKVDKFALKRILTYSQYKRFFEKGFSSFFQLPTPCHRALPSWFACPIMVKEEAPFTRTMLTDYLAKQKIETRNLFGGNLLRQPAYLDISYRAHSKGLQNTDYVMNNAFFLGVSPIVTSDMADTVCAAITSFIRECACK